ncbi:MAG TPA: glycosyltransferase family 2 protein [Candidatus Dormibacteraeota bacterium]|nr:glycosyltransferase family 2 protein [Candidatus Dormibacteraeota bacterium]
MAPRASVVVVTYNGIKYLPTCFEALLGQELEGGFEVILVDNSSSDGTAALVEERFPTVRLIRSESNLGFAGGNNLGIGAARGGYVILLNNDTRVRPGWLQALVATADSEPRAGAVASKLVLMNRPGILNNCGSMLLSDGSGADRGWQEQDEGQYETREEVFGACGNGVLLRREMLDDVGLLDETFFTYYEDTDLNWRLRLRGWIVIYEPTAVVEHVHAGTSVEWSPLFTFHVDRNRLFMILKNASPGMVARTYMGFTGLALKNLARALVWRYVTHKPTTVGGGLGAGRGRIHVRVVASLLRHLPEMLGKRWHIRGRRKVSDAEIAKWFYPRKLWDNRSA